DAVQRFQDHLRSSPPPLAYIESVAVQPMPVQGATQFTIVHSETQAQAGTLVSPDVCICDDCLRELFDPANRRYRYPFINCTHCGPRFTIIRDVPYDRPLTTMAVFPMCPDCLAEYENMLNRRFHAQPNACPVCGPRVWLQTGDTVLQSADAAIQEAQRQLVSGAILAVKGIGGFHLACEATSDAALERLRERKGRVAKPFAVMMRDLEIVRQYAEVSDAEAALLTSRERPIVLLRKKPAAGLSDQVAPGNTHIGVMLPYTPLHYLLIGTTPLVMTSGNLSGEPIAYDNAEAQRRLAPLVDAFLLHNRDIYVPCDDSVVRSFRGVELPIRRSRGYAPFPVKLPFMASPVLAAGGELKNTFCLLRDEFAFMSQHIGDMENLETLDAFERAVAHFKTLFHAEPMLLVCDQHPRYLASQWARRTAARDGVPLVEVQHHHAHIAAVMAEHGDPGERPVIGVCFDGTGYGTDGAIWGGEVLIADYRGFRRAAHLKYVPLPGGDSTVRHPSRLALAYLWAAGLDWDARLAPVAANTEAERRVFRRQLDTGFNAVPTSSMGRLFDAAAALAGVRQTITYEAQAAIEFEALFDDGIADSYPFTLVEPAAPDAPLIIDPAPCIAAIVDDVQRGVPPSTIAARFHNAAADIVARVVVYSREREGLNRVALSGGVFQNVVLLARTLDRLARHGFEVYTHQKVPPNDGGLALGQAVIGWKSLPENA
ncbi:MAG TPA: carbamoyltransferase HypF, partial [Aggregatilineales bacterium]|nr:carbamoyltransferase HypF [Aggregatilineales bacterium]